MNIQVSVIITTYKREPKMVMRAVKSALNQTYRNIEIIVVDDSPCDYVFRQQVQEVVQQQQKTEKEIAISYIPHKNNKGACVARNTGLFAAKGKYVAYLDDDDEWVPKKIEKQINVLSNSKAALVYCGCICKNDETGACYERRMNYQRGFIFDKLLYENFIDSTSFPLIKKECLISIGGFDTLMQSAQDYDVWLRLAEKYEVDYVPEPLVVYHLHSGEQISTNPVKKVSGLERINHKYQKYIDANPKLWHRRHIVLTPYYAQKGEYKKALNVWRRCVGKAPLEIIDNIRYLRAIIKTQGET